MFSIKFIAISLLLLSLVAFYTNYTKLGYVSLVGATISTGVWYFGCKENGILSSELCSMSFSSSLQSDNTSLN